MKKMKYHSKINIGNSINYCGWNCKIINIQDKLVTLQNNMTKTHYYTGLRHCKGIILTKYILISLGFKKSLRTWVNGDLKIYNKPVNLLQVYYFEGRRIKYVHELENIINEKRM